MLENLKQFNLAEIEEKVLAFWKQKDIFKKSVQRRVNKKPFRFFEGPPTANGRPGLHHGITRVFKDIVLRYKTMRGFYAPRRAGWDTHGLPVEIEVEKQLGLKNKQEIEKYGIAEFNAKTKESVWKYKDEWERFTDRIGFWLDLSNPYVTYDNNYIETLWWILAQIDKKALLKKLYKVVPWCPRCQTPLSSHELGQPGAYRKVKDPSLYVKFRLRGTKQKEFLLVWTTTPWTLPANVAIAVNAKLTYTKYKAGDEYLWSFNLPPKIEGRDIEVVEKISGHKLIGKEYEALFSNAGEHKVIAADFVSTEEGTGLVHIAPAFGEDDLRVAGKGEIPVTIDDRGMVIGKLPGAGKFIKEADKDIIADLARRGLIEHLGEIEHDYPFCWRCSSLLVYFARYSWFIEMSKLRNELLSANKKINWIPAHLQEGRFGEWLREIKDWSIARNRYWGTPLPIWECGVCQEYYVVDSLQDLDIRAYNKNRFILVRHGRADHNVRNMLSENPEKNWISKLTAEGAKQIESIAKKLKKEKPTVIYTSPFERTQQTAKIIAEATGVKVVVDDRLRELNAGELNGKPQAEYDRFYGRSGQPVLAEFVKRPPGGENFGDLRKRALEFLKDVNNKHRDEIIIIVGHGHPLLALMGVMGGLTNETMLDVLIYPQVGGYQEIAAPNIPRDQSGFLDAHRPFIDGVYLRCQKCKGKMTRVKEVADVWFDSGSMPYAQDHFPFGPGGQKKPKNVAGLYKKLNFPADYICEAIDQTRGWFYTLLAVSVLLGRGAPYKNVISLGHVLDKNGQKMSKSKGNVVEPNELIKKYGADALRWYFYTINPPGEPKRFDEQDLGKTLRSFFLILYNSFNFFKNYGFTDGQPNKKLDDWVLARLAVVAKEATEALEDYEIGEAAKIIEHFVIEDLSHWYIRRSRKNVSPVVLGKVLLAVSKLIAPFTPFFAEALYQSTISGREQALSVHLEDWPKNESSTKLGASKKLLAAMAEIRRLASSALAEREKAGIKIRQPLQKLTIKNSKLKDWKDLLMLLQEEANVKEIRFDPKLKNEVELDTEITPELRHEGLMRDLTRIVQGLRHDAGYVPADIIIVAIEGPAELADIINKHLAGFKKDVKARAVEFKKAGKFDAEINTKLDERPIWASVRKL